MKPRSTAHVLALALCVLALFVAQAFGGHRGFICICSGKPVPTQTSHCYGPHSADCHSDEGACGEENHQSGTEDRRDHQAVSDEVQARPSEAAPQVVAPQVFAAILPLAETIFASVEIKDPAAGLFKNVVGSPPLGVTVARTVALRI